MKIITQISAFDYDEMLQFTVISMRIYMHDKIRIINHPFFVRESHQGNMDFHS